MATTVYDLRAVLGLDSSEYKKGLSEAKADALSLSSGLKSAMAIGAKAIAATTTAVVGFGAASVKTGAEFDKSMSQVYATMAEKADAVIQDGQYAGMKASEALRDFAQEMGRTTQYTASQSAEALNYMALAGYNATEAMSMLPNVMNLAAAGGFDLARASDMVTDASTAFGLSVEEDGERITQMIDEMAKAASTGNTSVEQLGDAFLVVGGLAQELNGGMVELADGTTAEVDGIQELEIALTAMANAGVKGSEAGTHMRNMLLKLSSPTDAGTKQLEKLGVKVFDTEGNMRSLADVFGDLNGALGNLTQEQKIQAISDLFNTRDLASAEALLNAVGQDWNEIGEAIVNADGAAEEMKKTQMDNLAGDVEYFKSALEGAKIAISDVLTPEIRKFVQFGTDGLSRLTEAFKNGGLEGAMEEFGSILSDGISMIVSKSPQIFDAGLQLLSALGQGLMDNIDVILFAVGDVISMIFQRLLESSQSEGGNVMLEIINWILGVFQENYTQLMDIGMQILVNILNGIAENLPETIQYVTDLLTFFMNALIDNLPLIIDAGGQILLELALGIADALPELIPTIVDVILTIIEALVDNADLLIEAAVAIIVGLATGLINSLPKLIEKGPVIIDKLVKALIDALPKVVEAGLKLILALIDGIIKSIPKILPAVKQVKETFTDGILELLNSANTWGRDLINNFIGGLKEKWNDLKSTVSDMAGTVSEYLHFSEPDVGPLSNFSTYAPDMMELFAKGIRDNTDLVANQIEKSFDFEDDIVSSQNIFDKKSSTSKSGKENSDSKMSVNVYLEGIASEIMRVVRTEARKEYNASGNNVVVYGG